MDKTLVLFGRTFTNKYAKALRDLTPEERDRLSKSVKNRGVLDAVFHDEQDNVIDGWNRLELARDYGLAQRQPGEKPRPGTIAFLLLDGMTDDEKITLAKVKNIARRQLDNDEIEALIASILKREPAKSNRTVADEVKTSPKKVAEVRQTLEAKQEIPETPVRTTTDGAAVPAEKKPKPEKKKPPEGPATETRDDVTTVPQHLADAFQEARRMEEIAKSLRSMAMWLKTSCASWNRWLMLGEAVELAERLEKLLVDATPAAVCPLCKGHACKGGCRMTGWVPKWKEEELEHEAKGKRN